MLKEKYEHKRKIVYSHVQSLLQIPIISKQNHEALNTLINTADRHMLCLNAYGITTDSWDALIVPILLAKVDPVTTRLWQSKIEGDLNNTEILIKTL